MAVLCLGIDKDIIAISELLGMHTYSSKHLDIFVFKYMHELAIRARVEVLGP